MKCYQQERAQTTDHITIYYSRQIVCALGGGATSKEDRQMRVEIPRAEAHFVKKYKIEENKNRYNITTVNGVIELWKKVEQLSNVPVEFKTGNWVLESIEELTEEHINSRWTLNVRYSNFSSYTNIEYVGGVLDFYGSATSDAHQLLASLSDEITKEGYLKFESYRTAHDTAESTIYRQKKIVKNSKSNRIAGEFSNPTNQSSKANLEALYKAFLYVGRLYRNMLIVAITIAAFTRLDLLSSMILGIIPPVVALGVLVFGWEREILTKRGRIEVVDKNSGR